MQTASFISHENFVNNIVKTNYSFVNWIRCVAMFSIVYEHSIAWPVGAPEDVTFSPLSVLTTDQMNAVITVTQPMKFGTICFFIISGFLLDKKLANQQSPWAYYKRRLQTVGIPFLIAFGLFYCKSVFYGFYTGRYVLSPATINFIWGRMWDVLLSTSYWFMASFLLALLILIAVWKVTGYKLFKVVMLFIPILFGLNVYFEWFETRHTMAVPAYVSYLYLGAWLSRNESIIQRIQKLPVYWLLLILPILGLSLAEAYYFDRSGSYNAFNTLRPANQLYSLAVFGGLLLFNPLHRLSWLNPRDESFGIYLYHMFVVAILAKAVYVIPALNVLNYHHEFSGWQLAVVSLIRSVLIYGMTLIFVKLVNRTRFRWLFGNR